MGVVTKHWRAWLGFGLAAFRFASDLDFAASLIRRAPYGDKVIDFVTSTPSILFFAAGLGLIGWDYVRNVRAPAIAARATTDARSIPSSIQPKPRPEPRSPPPLPDMPIMELAERIYKNKGPMPPLGRERRTYWDEVSQEIIRGVVFNKLHMWAAEGEYRFDPIPTSILKRAQLLHESSSLSYLPSPDGVKRRWLTQLELNRAEVSKIWPE